LLDPPFEKATPGMQKGNLWPVWGATCGLAEATVSLGFHIQTVIGAIGWVSTGVVQCWVLLSEEAQ